MCLRNALYLRNNALRLKLTVVYNLLFNFILSAKIPRFASKNVHQSSILLAALPENCYVANGSKTDFPQDLKLFFSPIRTTIGFAQTFWKIYKPLDTPENKKIRMLNNKMKTNIGIFSHRLKIAHIY